MAQSSSFLRCSDQCADFSAKNRSRYAALLKEAGRLMLLPVPTFASVSTAKRYNGTPSSPRGRGGGTLSRAIRLVNRAPVLMTRVLTCRPLIRFAEQFICDHRLPQRDAAVVSRNQSV